MTDPTPHDRDDRLERRLEELPDVTASDSFRRDLRDAFTSGAIAADSDPRARRTRRAWWAIPIAAAAVVLVALLVLTGGSSKPELIGVVGQGDVRIDGQSFPVAGHEALAAALAEATEIRVPADVRITIRFPDFATFEIAAGSTVSLPSPTRVLAGRVASGELRLKTEPGFAGKRIRITTPEGLVDVTGTLLSVQRGPMGTCVCVLEGTAHVGRDEADLEPVPPGSRKTIAIAGETAISPVKPMHRDGVVDFDARVGRAIGASMRGR